MNKLQPFIIIATVIISACDKHKSVASVIAQATGGTTLLHGPAPDRGDPPAYRGQTKSGAFLFVMAGQSNMAGDGQDPEFQDHPRIHLIGGHNAGASYAFALSFVNDNPQAEVYLANCSLGGTTIEQWNQSGTLYQGCIALASRAPVPPSALLFFQGEANGLSNINPDNWAYNFKNIAQAYRSDFNNQSLPILFAQIGWNARDLPEWDIVKKQQESIHIPGIKMIYTDDLDYSSPQGVHFTPNSYLRIGKRFTSLFYEN